MFSTKPNTWKMCSIFHLRGNYGLERGRPETVQLVRARTDSRTSDAPQVSHPNFKPQRVPDFSASEPPSLHRDMLPYVFNFIPSLFIPAVRTHSHFHVVSFRIPRPLFTAFGRNYLFLSLSPLKLPDGERRRKHLCNFKLLSQKRAQGKFVMLNDLTSEID